LIFQIGNPTLALRKPSTSVRIMWV